MKVTVCFGSVRVVVPCGNGDILIGDLIEEAVTRYKKATGKPSAAWVTVHNLKSVNDGGILDPDDRLRDVADDREQILAIYEEQSDAPYFMRHQSVLNHHHNGGDGSSGSSTNCDTPDLVFHVDVDGGPADGPADCHTTDVEISGDGVPSGVSVLQVRRGSEPALNKLLPIHSSSYLDPMKRWSTAIVLDGSNPKRFSSERGTKGHHSDGDFLSDREDGSGGEDRSSFSHFSRDSMRSSVLGNSDEGPPHHLTIPHSRREPLGGPKDTGHISADIVQIVIQNDGSPLGIHVVPECDTSERDFGLVVQCVDPGGKIEQDGRISVNDRIIEINGKSVLNVNFHRAQDMFKTALYAAEIRLKVQKFGGGKLDARIHRSLPPSFIAVPEKNFEQSDAVHAEHSASENIHDKILSVSPPLRKTTQHHNNHQYSHNTNAMLSSNTRKIGKKYPIQLTKGHHGLGFSITTRDNLAGVNCPIYVKNILPKGAAIEDGRLRPGDRLLEVNGVQMTGKSQDDAVSLLRNAPLGSSVSLVVSRQEPESPKLPRKIPVQPVERTPSNDGHYFPWRQREILTFDIPLNDTGSAGLGVSVKGKTSTGPHGTTDLGIFVKSVIHGGAASKDGRLNENDQLININGVSLLCMPNSHAMETLRRVMHQEGPNPGAITLSVARRIHLPSSSTSSDKPNRQQTGGDRVSHRSESPYSGSHSSRMSAGNNSDRNRSLRTPSSMDSTTDSERTAIFRPYGAGGSGGVGFGGRGSGRSEERNLDHEDDVTKIEDKDLGLDCPSDSYNPIVERITGFRAPRNESYYHACCDGWNSPQNQPQQQLRTQHQHSGSNYNDTVMIEDESNPAMAHPPHSHQAPPSRSTNQQHSKEALDGAKYDRPTNVGKDGVAIGVTNVPTSASDPKTTFTSQMSLDEDSANFDRDGFGRQSMSEKRNAQLDARNTDTYQRNKKARELAKEMERQQPATQQKQQQQKQQPPLYPEAAPRRFVRYPPNYMPSDHVFGYVTDGSTSNLVRCNSADSIISGTHRQMLPTKTQHSHPATIMTLKSNSLESVQRASQGVDTGENDGDPNEIYGKYKDGSGRGATAIRNRGCNESFRAAVDRSYDAPLGSGEAMETLDEEAETGVPSRVLGRAYSVCATLPPPEQPDESERYNKKNKKRGILRNLGQVFKFGKANKKGPDMTANGRFGFIDTDFHKVDAEMMPAKYSEPDLDRFCELKKCEGQMRFGNDSDHQQQYSQRHAVPSSGSGGAVDEYQANAQWQNANAAKSSSSHQDRMSNLRTQHQKKHQERQGQYPMDDQEERLQRKTLDKVKERQPYESDKVEAIHSRSHSYDTCTDNRQSSSRPSGNTIYSSNKYGHYVNYEEIQHHIRRRDDQPIRPVPIAAAAARERPMSNFYEYESINQPAYKMNPSGGINPPPPLSSSSSASATARPSMVPDGHRAFTNHGSLRGNPPPIAKKKQTSSSKHSSSSIQHPSNNNNINNNNNNNASNNNKKYMNVISSRESVPASKV